MKYEDFTVLHVRYETIGTRTQKNCWITDGLYEFNVICGEFEDPILVYIEANQ